MRLSVIVPAYNEADGLQKFLVRLDSVLANFPDAEIIVVDDGSTDATLDILRAAAAGDSRLQYLSLTRNFGHQTALRAGLECANGDAVITMDADLQHPPEQIPRMVERWRSGCEVVNMLREDDDTPFFKRITSTLFYRFINSISDYRVEPGSSDFRLLDRKVVAELNRLPERGVFLRGVIPWMGYRQCNFKYRPEPRHAGASKYSLRKMIGLGLAGVTSSSYRPLHLTTFMGVVMSLFAMLYAMYALGVKLFVGTAISGWTSLLLSIMLFGGVQLIMLGIIGEYLGRVLREVKGRPEFVVRESSVGIDQAGNDDVILTNAPTRRIG